MARKRQDEYNTNDELWTVLEDEAAKMDPTFIKNLFKSIPKRINALGKAKGGATKY